MSLSHEKIQNGLTSYFPAITIFSSGKLKTNIVIILLTNIDPLQLLLKFIRLLE